MAPHLSVHSRNDLIQDARMLLDEPCFHCFLQYTQALSRALPSYRGPAPAEPISLQGNAHSRAETLAMQILANGQCSMWESVRQVASLLNFERPRHKNMVEQTQAYSFTVGVYARQQLVGLAKETLTHSNVCRLLCSYIGRLCPSFCWTTLAFHLK